MRLLHLLGTFKLPRTPEDGAPGVVRAALEVARAQAARGHAVTVAAVGAEAWARTWHGVTLLQLQSVPWARATVAGRTLDLSAHAPFVRLTRRHRFDVVQGHLYYYLRFLRAGARVAHFHADPLYGTDDEAGGAAALRAKRADFRVIARSSDAQVAVSRFVAGQVARGMALVGAEPDLYTVYNGVRHEHFEPAAAALGGRRLRRDLGIPDGTAVFLFVGALVPEKGLLHLARAFCDLARRDPHVHLLVAGSASLWDMAGQTIGRGYESAVQGLLRPLADAGRVHLLGTTKSSVMPAVYAASDVAVVPSVWPEPFGLVALEARAAGRPVIASNIGGLAEAAGHAGHLVPPGDEAALGAALRAFMDPDRRRAHGWAAEADVRSFSWDEAAAGLERVYRAALPVRA